MSVQNKHEQASPTEPATPAIERPKRGPTSTSWRPGRSGNPKGRPRTGLAFAEAVRKHLDPETALAFIIRFCKDETQPYPARVAAMFGLIDRGYVKPPIGVAIASIAPPELDFAHLSEDELRERLAWLRGQPLVTAGENDSDDAT